MPTKDSYKEEADRKRQEQFEKMLEEQHSMVFKKKELILIFNVLTRLDCKYSDFLAIAPIIEKLQPIVAVDTNIPQEQPAVDEKEGVVV